MIYVYCVRPGCEDHLAGGQYERGAARAGSLSRRGFCKCNICKGEGSGMEVFG